MALPQQFNSVLHSLQSQPFVTLISNSHFEQRYMSPILGAFMVGSPGSKVRSDTIPHLRDRSECLWSKPCSAALGPEHRLLIENCSNVVASIFVRQPMNQSSPAMVRWVSRDTISPANSTAGCQFTGASREMRAIRFCSRIENGNDALIWKSHNPRFDEWYLLPVRLATEVTAKQPE